MIIKSNTAPKSKIDLSGNGYSILDSTCKKCGSTKELKLHSITYTPNLQVTLCKECFRQIVGLYSRGSYVASGNIETKLQFTNKLRVILWKWFIVNLWPLTKTGKPIKGMTKGKVAKILIAKGIKCTKRTKKQMYSVPWKHDFKNNCVKCNRAYHLQKHHIIYTPSTTAFLCEKCHKKITNINTFAAGVANTSKVNRPNYTNRIRVTLWKWFLSCKDDSINAPTKAIIQEVLKTNKSEVWSKSPGIRAVTDTPTKHLVSRPHISTTVSATGCLG